MPQNNASIVLQMKNSETVYYTPLGLVLFFSILITVLVTNKEVKVITVI